MSKCKKNILLIFGYLLIVAILFIPYIKFAYYIPKYFIFENGKSKEIAAPPVGYILDKPFKPASKLSSKSLNRKGFRFLPLYLFDAISYQKFKNWKNQITKESTKYLNEEKKIITTEELFKLEYKFIEKYKGYLIYDKVRLDFFLTELAIIILAGGFTYILFCVVLRKSEKRGEK